MNKLFFFLILLFVSMAGCSSYKSVEYHINRSWYDSQSIYVLYERINKTNISFLLNVHGGSSVADATRVTYVKRYNNDIVMKGLFNLENDGELVKEYKGKDDLNYYVDQDFLIQENNNITTFFSGSNKVKFKCDHSDWEYLMPLKFGSTVFYCGHFISNSSKVSYELSPMINARLQSLRTVVYPTYLKSTLSIIAEERCLIVKSNEENLSEMLRIPIDSRNDVESLRPEYFKRRNYEMLNLSQAFSPNYFVMKLLDKENAIQICNAEQCDVINHKHPFNYIVIDNAKHLSFFLYNNFYDPDVKVEVVKFQRIGQRIGDGAQLQ